MFCSTASTAASFTTDTTGSNSTTAVTGIGWFFLVATSLDILNILVGIDSDLVNIFADISSEAGVVLRRALVASRPCPGRPRHDAQAGNGQTAGVAPVPGAGSGARP